MTRKILLKIFLFLFLQLSYSQNTIISNYGLKFSYSDNWKIFPLDSYYYSLKINPLKLKLKHPIAFTFSIDIDSTTNNLNNYYEKFKNRMIKTSEDFSYDWKFSTPEKYNFKGFESYTIIATCITNLTPSEKVSCTVKSTIIPHKDRIVSLTTKASNSDYIKYVKYVDQLYKSFDFDQKEINDKKKLQEASYLNPKELLFNSRYFQDEVLLTQYYIPLFHFNENYYTKLSVKDKRYKNEKWVLYSLDEFTPIIKGQLIYDSKSNLVIQNLNSETKILYDYDNYNRPIKISYILKNMNKQGAHYIYEYPDKNTIVVNKGILIKTIDKSKRLIKEIKNSDPESSSGSNIKLINKYTYNDKNLVKMIQRTIEVPEFNKHEKYNLNFSYKYNKFGDWIESYITKSDSTNSSEKPYRLIQRTFE